MYWGEKKGKQKKEKGVQKGTCLFNTWVLQDLANAQNYYEYYLTWFLLLLLSIGMPKGGS